MDVGLFFKNAAEFFFKICAVKFTIFGYSVSAAAVFVFSGLIIIVGNFIKNLGD